ncbi:glucosaminidase domain-containing protein [Blattabacterium sp. DPU]|uniref:glycoside hydrolase family 73 protein n=1 Tax=Blattabacterium sp. DPU TaxID=2715232 RepID=UPI00140DBA11|nr:glucosaminidase domain-containing protein [Blattabacterium sp. DPU]QIK16769.1 glucosaminidase domain-containing protein [Blattabacterium sp. DPU]
MKKFFYFILFFSMSLFSFSQKKYKEKEIENVIEYIKKYAAFAVEEMEKFGIPASIKLGQGILESSSGNSSLSKATNNHFGIKCGKNWRGDVYYHDDDIPQECFRKYNSVRESFHDHSKFLKQPRYSKLFLLKKNDYQAWATELKKAGYATSLNYANLLIDQIEKYYLWKFDQKTTSSIEKRISQYLNYMKNKDKDSFFTTFSRKVRFFIKNLYKAIIIKI